MDANVLKALYQPGSVVVYKKTGTFWRVRKYTPATSSSGATLSVENLTPNQRSNFERELDAFRPFRVPFQAKVYDIKTGELVGQVREFQWVGNVVVCAITMLKGGSVQVPAEDLLDEASGLTIRKINATT